MWFTFAIISAFCASLATIVEKKVLEKEHSDTFSAILSVFAAIMTLPALYVYRDFDIPLIVWPILIASSLLATLAFLEVTSGIRHLDISNSAPLFLLSPLMTALLAFVFLGEKLMSCKQKTYLMLGVFFLI
jgi:drug/metabolite transporter (DMT)-like permease